MCRPSLPLPFLTTPTKRGTSLLQQAPVCPISNYFLFSGSVFSHWRPEGIGPASEASFFSLTSHFPQLLRRHSTSTISLSTFFSLDNPPHSHSSSTLIVVPHTQSRTIIPYKKINTIVYLVCPCCVAPWIGARLRRFCHPPDLSLERSSQPYTSQVCGSLFIFRHHLGIEKSIEAFSLCSISTHSLFSFLQQSSSG